MPTSATGVFVAVLAAATWIALGIESIVRPEQENYRDALWIIPFALTAIAFCYVHAVQHARATRFGIFSFYFLMVASFLVFLGNVGVLANEPILAKLGFPVGALLWMLGLVLFGIGTWTANTLPRYVAVAIMLLEPGSLATGLAFAPIAPLHERGAYSAGIEKGLVLALVAVGMRTVLRQINSQKDATGSTHQAA